MQITYKNTGKLCLLVAASVLVHCLENVFLIVNDKGLVSGVVLGRRKADLCYDVVHRVLWLPPFFCLNFGARLAVARNQIVALVERCL